jgi:predicted DNA-binding transcriptional regulator AlpA
VSEQAGIAPTGEPTDFEVCLARVNPSKASLQQPAKQADDTPVIMLNLLRFRPRGDATIYSMYDRETAPEVEKVGSFIGHYGAVITDLDPALGFDARYDAVVMPVSHRRSSYLALQRSSIYQLIIPYRSAGTSRRTLYVLSDG